MLLFTSDVLQNKLRSLDDLIPEFSSGFSFLTLSDSRNASFSQLFNLWTISISMLSARTSVPMYTNMHCIDGGEIDAMRLHTVRDDLAKDHPKILSIKEELPELNSGIRSSKDLSLF